MTIRDPQIANRTPNIADGSITTAKIADNSITNSKIVNGAVTASQIDAVLGIPTSGDINGSAAYWRPNFISTFSTTAITLNTVGQAISSAFVFNTEVIISEIGHRSGPTATFGQMKYVIYSCPTGSSVPTTKVYESSTINVTATNTTYSVTGLSVSLDAGVYWIFAYVVSTGCSIYAYTATSPITPLAVMSAAANPSVTSGSWLLTSGPSTPPSTLSLTPSSNINGYPFPCIAIRRSS